MFLLSLIAKLIFFLGIFRNKSMFEIGINVKRKDILNERKL